MSCSIVSAEPGHQVGYPSTGMWEDRFDSTAMPVDSVAPSRLDFLMWRKGERAVASRSLTLSNKANGHVSNCQIVMNQMRYLRAPMGLPARNY